jgi:hypothetical protein
VEALTPIITQLIAGAVGGNAVGAMLKQEAVSVVTRTIAGAIGGIGGGILLNMLGGEAGLSTLVANGIGGLIGGGVLQAIVGTIMSRSK